LQIDELRDSFKLIDIAPLLPINPIEGFLGEDGQLLLSKVLKALAFFENDLGLKVAEKSLI
jgi:hypothetical protein